jgi:chemotaxis signal transduction protein
MVQLLLFSVGEVRGAIPLEETSRVIRMVMPERKADARPWEAGTINLHGRTVPIVSLRILFGLPSADPRLKDMLIIAHGGGNAIALWVDTTSGVQDIPLFAGPTGIESSVPLVGNGIQKTADGIHVIYDLVGFISSGGYHLSGYTVEGQILDPGKNDCSVTNNDEAGEDHDTQYVRAILSERAKKISRPEEDLSASRRIEVLRFRIAYREYAIEMQHIREVILTGEITPVPGTPDYISGICVVRGEIISLVDLRVLLTIPEKGLTDLNRVIVLSDHQLSFGILADHITGIGSIELNSIDLTDTDTPQVRMPYVKGIADGSLVVLDTAALFADPKMIIDES